MVNELYLALLYRPVTSAATGLVARLLSRAQADASQLELSDALDACAKLAQTLRASLARYEPELLGAYRVGKGLVLVGARVSRRRWSMASGNACRYLAAPLNEALATTRLLFGAEAIEYRTPTGTRVGAILGIKEYPTPTVVGMYDRLLSAPFPLVLTQSFTFLSKADQPGSAAATVPSPGECRGFRGVAGRGAQGAPSTRSPVTSSSWATIISVCRCSPMSATDDGDLLGYRTAQGPERPCRARAQLPGRHRNDGRSRGSGPGGGILGSVAGKLRHCVPARRRITSRNFAAMMPFHNYPSGRATGNHWGDALALLCDERSFSLLLLPARERSHRTLTAAAARIPGTPSSAAPPAPARLSSLVSWSPCCTGRA